MGGEVDAGVARDVGVGVERNVGHAVGGRDELAAAQPLREEADGRLGRTGTAMAAAVSASPHQSSSSSMKNESATYQSARSLRHCADGN
jgi:hypothetical protein